MSKLNTYEAITEAVVKGLETKGLKWFKSWGAVGDAPVKHTTLKPYGGINVLLLNAAFIDGNYTHNEWVTFKEAKANGGSVRKGEKSVAIYAPSIAYKAPNGKLYFGETALRKAGFEPSECERKFMPPRQWRVFNIAQCDGITPKTKPVEKRVHNPIEAAERVYECYPSAVRPELVHGGSEAVYMNSLHKVKMPVAESFVTADDYYKTLFHELVHSTGAKNILNRKTLAEPARFGSTRYAQEELVAEIGAMMLEAIVGTESTNDSQAYINGYARKLKDAPKMAYFAAAQAIKAVEFIRDGKY